MPGPGTTDTMCDSTWGVLAKSTVQSNSYALLTMAPRPAVSKLHFTLQQGRANTGGRAMVVGVHSKPKLKQGPCYNMRSMHSRVDVVG
jgi:hypothetical protein